MDQLLSDVSEIKRPRWKNRAEAANVYITLELRPTTNALVMGDASELREVLVNMLLVTPSNILNESIEIFVTGGRSPRPESLAALGWTRAARGALGLGDTSNLVLEFPLCQN